MGVTRINRYLPAGARDEEAVTKAMQATGITHPADQAWIPFLADNASARGSRWCWPRKTAIMLLD